MLYIKIGNTEISMDDLMCRMFVDKHMRQQEGEDIDIMRVFDQKIEEVLANIGIFDYSEQDLKDLRFDFMIEARSIGE